MKINTRKNRENRKKAGAL